MPACDARPNVDVPAHAKVFRFNSFVRRRIGENGFGMDASLVGEGTESSNILCNNRSVTHVYYLILSSSTYIVERHTDLHSICYEILYLAECNKVVLRLDIVGIRDVHSSDQATKRLA